MPFKKKKQQHVDETAAKRDKMSKAAAGAAKNKWQAYKQATRGKDGKYSATTELVNAKDSLKDNMAKATTVGSKIGAVVKFLLHLLHVLVRSLWRVFVVVAVVLVVVAVIGFAGLGYLYFTSASELPDIEDYTKITMPQDSTIYDTDGEIIGIVATVSRDSVGFGEISQPLKDAVVSIEDERFYNHEGVDLMGVARALFVNFQEWRNGGDSTSQGASTITQQYVRNAYEQVGTEATISRKLTEMMLAIQLESSMSKDDILNSYLNTIYFGNGCYGVEAASKYYFGHSANTLDYYEAAVLAAILNGPAIYDPTTEEGSEATAERVNLVLDKMYSLGKLGNMSQEDLRSLKTTDINDKINITETDRVINQPFYYDYVMSELGDAYSTEEVESGGWQIYTTLSIADGKEAEEVVRGVEEKYAGTGITAAIADVDTKTGAIHAFCGGTDYQASQYNIATSGHLQTGSTLKPLIYAGLCEYKGYYFSDSMDCTPVNIGTAENPHMITPYIRGSQASLKSGIVQSDNAMTIHVAQTLGMDKVQEVLYAEGIKSEVEDNVVIAIGGQTNGMTPVELASAYSTIERGGKQIDYWCITQITDGLGNLVYKHEDEEGTYAVSEEVALQTIDAMKSAVDSAGWYNIPYDKKGWTIAAKTGTTNDDMDSWCVGFNKDRSVALWVGGRDNKVTVANSSYNTTTSFSNYFERVGQKDKKEDWKKPQYKTLVPDIEENQSLEEYMNFVQERQLGVSIEYVSAKNAESGEIIGVKNAGEYINRGEPAIVQVARDMVAVPNFVGMTPAEAYNAASGLDLSFSVTYSTSGSSQPTVKEQSIDPGEVVTEGSEIVLDITILITQGDGSKTQEQLPFLGANNALSILESERDGLLTQNEDLIAQLEALQAQQQGAGGQEYGTLKVPNIIGLTSTDSRQILRSLGLKIVYTGETGDVITSVSPDVGTSVASGEVITIVSASSIPEEDEAQGNGGTGDDDATGTNTGTSSRFPSVINRNQLQSSRN